MDVISKNVPFVSVVVLTHNRRESVLTLMYALHQQDYLQREIILVDNCSTDGTVEVVAAQYPSVRVLRSSRNVGSAAYNLGMADARGKYILMMDDDGLPSSSTWISQVVERFELVPQLGVVACTVRMRDTGLVAYDSPQFIPEGDPRFGFPAAAYNGTGAGLRADAVRQVGYYPEHYFLSWIELHLCTRLIDAGWEVRYFPDIEVWHCRPSNSVNRPNSFYGLRNYLWYVWTFYPWPDIVAETAHYLASCVMRVVRRQIPLAVMSRALLQAFVGLPAQVKSRRPISRKTLRYLRAVRRHGNLADYADRIRLKAESD